MERTLRDAFEWVILGLLAVVGALLLFWLGGWVFTLLGRVFLALADLLWALLRYALPVLLLLGVGYGVYYLLKRKG